MLFTFFTQKHEKAGRSYGSPRFFAVLLGGLHDQVDELVLYQNGLDHAHNLGGLLHLLH